MDGTKAELATVCGNKQTRPTFLLSAAHQSLLDVLQKNPQQAGIKDEARTNPPDRCTFYDLVFELLTFTVSKMFWHK